MSIVCSIWGCHEIAEHQELHNMSDGNSYYLYYCWKHKKVKDDKDELAALTRQKSLDDALLLDLQEKVEKLTARAEAAEARLGEIRNALCFERNLIQLKGDLERGEAIQRIIDKIEDFLTPTQPAEVLERQSEMQVQRKSAGQHKICRWCR